MRKRIVTLLSVTLILMLLGLIYAYSVVLAPLKTAFGWSVTQMTAIFATSIICYILGSLAGARLYERHGLRPCLLVSAAALASGFLACSLAQGSAAYAITLAAYGIVASAGIGCAYNVLLPVVSDWYPDKTGVSQGTCLMGFGLGGFVLGPLVTWMYSVAPYRLVLAALGITFGLVVMAAAFLLRRPTADEAAALPVPQATGEGLAPSAAVDTPTSVVLRTSSYRLMLTWLFLIGGVGLGVTGIGRELPAALGVDALTSAFVIGFVNVGSGLGRLLGGMLADRHGRRGVMYLASTLVTVAMAGNVCALMTGSLPVMAVSLGILGFAWGVDVMMMVFVARTLWGQRHMPTNLAALNANSVPASLVGSVGAGMLMEATGSVMLPLAIMCAAAACSMLVARLANDAMERPGRTCKGVAHAAAN